LAASPIAHLTGTERRQLFDDLYYLNTAEIKSFCNRHSIPYRIWIETSAGRRRTNEDDRKGVMLERIRHFLRTRKILPETCFPARVVNLDPARDTLNADDRLFYGQYDKSSRAMMSLLADLTDGQFKDGAIARILARSFWTRGEAPTFKEFAATWLEAKRNHTGPDPEAAYLSDLAAGSAPADWKKLRVAKAAKVIKILDRIGR
jgi:hypothetical protein